MNGRLKRFGQSISAYVLFSALLAFFAPLPAHGCSCGGQGDIRAAIDQAEAAFVGTLVDKRGGGFGFASSAGAIYVFEVEQWVKADLGEVIEVHSGQGGGDCGFSGGIDDRIGALVWREDDHLAGGLCSQVDPDVLLAAAFGTVTSETGIGYLLVGGGGSSPVLIVLDEAGGTAAKLDPQGLGGFDGGGDMSVCPGGTRMAQLTPAGVNVWNLATLEITATIAGFDPDGPWMRSVSCRDEDASVIWAVMATESTFELRQIAPELTHIVDLPDRHYWQVGSDYIVGQYEGEDDPIAIDIETGDATLLHTTPPDELWSITVAPHPSKDLIALVETRFSAGERPVEATLLILEPTGHTVTQFEIPWETYSPTWIDDHRVMVQAFNFDDWSQTFGLVFDVDSGETTVVEGWNAGNLVADGNLVYGVNGGNVLVANLTSREWNVLTTLPFQSAGSIILLRDRPSVDGFPHDLPSVGSTVPAGAVDAPQSTTPPLSAADIATIPERDGGSTLVARISLALLGVLGVAVWITRRYRPNPET